MDARSKLIPNDEAASSIIGFVAGLLVFTGSLAMVAYYVSNTPETASTADSQALQGAAKRATQTLTETPGEPKDWHTKSPIPDAIDRMGLLKDGTVRTASLEKIQHIQDGNLTHADLLDKLALRDGGYSMRVESRLVNTPLIQPPGTTTYGVVHSIDKSTSSQVEFDVSAVSQKNAERYAKANPDYSYARHNWTFGKTTAPPNELGNTIPDHAYFVETQLIPKMAGIAATYSSVDHQKNSQWVTESAHAATFNRYDSGNNAFSRWHVVEDGAPCEVPASAGAKSNGDHVLSVNYRLQDCSWVNDDGHRSVALLGGFDPGTAGGGELVFDHLLNATDPDTDPCPPENNPCIAINTSVIFWNTTASEWTVLDPEPNCGIQNWNGTFGNMSTDDKWVTKTVNLCEAVEHSTDKVWLGLFWDTSCMQNDETEMQCPTPNPQSQSFGQREAERQWFVDNLKVTFGGKKVFSTDFEPPKETGETLFLSTGVDYTRTHAPAEDYVENNTMRYIQSFVKNGSSVVALTPDGGASGNWLANVGLGAVSTSSTSDIKTKKPDSLVMKLPNILPERHSDYEIDNLAWNNTPPIVPLTNQKANELHGLEPLTPVQVAPDKNATLIWGTPYNNSGNVVAVAYNQSDINDGELRKEMMENIHTSSVFLDPGFEIGPEVPQGGTSEVITGRRMMLSPLTEGGQWTATVQITTWVWEQRIE